MEDDLYTITGGPLRPHEWVKIKSYISAADEAWVQNHSATLGGTRKNPQVVMTVGDVKLALLKRMIVTWSLTKTVQGSDGNEQQVPIPCTPQEIEKLPRRIFAYIHKEIDRLNPEEEEERDQDFSSAANGHSGGSLEPTSLFPLKG